jgi:hypothetical protein
MSCQNHNSQLPEFKRSTSAATKASKTKLNLAKIKINVKETGARESQREPQVLPEPVLPRGIYRMFTSSIIPVNNAPAQYFIPWSIIENIRETIGVTVTRNHLSPNHNLSEETSENLSELIRRIGPPEGTVIGALDFSSRLEQRRQAGRWLRAQTP